MTYIKILAVSVIALFSLQLGSIDDLVLDGSLKNETVEFSIQNLGSTPASISWIIIQDDVLFKSGSATVKPKEVTSIEVAKNPSGKQKYELVVTNQSATSETKSHVVQ